jgi:hypothetical protein
MRSSAVEARIADLDEMVTKGHIRRKSAVALGMPDRKVYAFSPPTRQIVVVG